jgi:hypothetical protein
MVEWLENHRSALTTALFTMLLCAVLAGGLRLIQRRPQPASSST